MIAKPKPLQEKKDFQWVLQTILPLKHENLFIPETLLFSNGVPDIFVFTSSSSTVRFTKKIKFHEIISLFMRKASSHNSVIHCSIESSPSKLSPVIKITNKNIAIFRSTHNTLTIVENQQLVDVLLEKPYKILWPDLVSIQSLVDPSKTPLEIHKLSLPSPGSSPAEKAMTQISSSLAEKCFKLLSADFEFIKDEQNTYWLTHMSNVLVQSIPKETNVDALVPMRMTPETRKIFLEGLDYHSSKLKSRRTSVFYELMDDHYQVLKEKFSIDEVLNSEFHMEVPEKKLPFLPPRKSSEKGHSRLSTSDPRNTERTVRRLSLFQSNEFKSMRCPRIKGRKLFE